MLINIAIDGPSASGKSTVAKQLCKKLNYKHLDTGAMYRCVALKCDRENININKDRQLKRMFKKIKIQLTEDGKVFLDGEDVSKEIRTDKISMLASDVSTKQIVRENLVALQQQIAADKGYVMDGRDIGTVVLKDAEVKIYLTASVEERARRRYEENISRGMEADMEQLKQEIIDRDYQDMHREFSPLTQAEDAVVIDSSDMTIEEVVDRIMELVDKVK